MKGSENNKMCLLCRDSKEYPYPDRDTHKLFNLHFTLGKTWKPEKGHRDYETHLRWIKLLNPSCDNDVMK